MLWAEREFQVHQSGGETPRHFLCGDYMRELSVFVDESGDFGPYSSHSPYYLFTLLFHDQENSINTEVTYLDRKVQEHGFDIHAIHTGPIIRNEGYYKNFSPDDRKDCSMIYYCSQDM